MSKAERFIRHLCAVMVADHLGATGKVKPGDPIALSIAETEVGVLNLRTREQHVVDVRPYIIEAHRLTEEAPASGAEVDRLMAGPVVDPREIVAN